MANIEEMGSPGEAKTRSEVSILTSVDFSRLYLMTSAGIKAVSPSVSCDKTFPEIKKKIIHCHYSIFDFKKPLSLKSQIKNYCGFQKKM